MFKHNFFSCAFKVQVCMINDNLYNQGVYQILYPQISLKLFIFNSPANNIYIYNMVY